MRGRGLEGRIQRYALHTVELGGQKLVGLGLNPGGGLGRGRAAMGGVVLEATGFGGLCEGVTTMPSARPVFRPRL